MSFINLAARICQTFEVSTSNKSKVALEYKSNVKRDIVTGLDMALNEASKKFLAKTLPDCLLFSEEGMTKNEHAERLNKGKWLVVDPLDGSLNFFHGMPFYGYMATYLLDGKILAAVIVLPKDGQYIVFEDGKLTVSKHLALSKSAVSSTVYYGYAPNQSTDQQSTRNILFDLIDKKTAGFYRYGSACAGLYNLICQNHEIFIGHGIRVWDALAYMPVLKELGHLVKYAITNNELTIVTGSNRSLIDEIEYVFRDNQGTTLTDYEPTKALEIASS